MLGLATSVPSAEKAGDAFGTSTLVDAQFLRLNGGKDRPVAAIGEHDHVRRDRCPFPPWIG